MRRHESLRTTFRSEAGQPLQVIAPSLSLPLEVVDLSGLPSEQREAELLRLVQEDAQRPFQLSTGPLLRTHLLRLSDSEHVLLLNMHHIISDGWSTGVLVRELAALYEAHLQGKPSPLPELPVQYADYAVWQRQWQSQVLERQLSYWKPQLAGAPQTLELPTDKPRPAIQSVRGAQLPVKLSKESSERLLQLCQREGVTPFMALLATFQLLLSRYSNQDDICVGSPIAGRRHAELEGLIGFFVNTLVLRSRIDSRTSFRSLLSQVRSTTLDAFEHQDVPFEKLVEELRPPRDLSRTPLFQVMFALQNAPMGNLELPGLSLRALPPVELTSKFDLTLFLSEGPEGFTGSLEYCADLFERDTAARMMSHLQVLLTSVLAQPEAPLSSLPLMTDAERQQVLVEWNATGAEYPREACVHELVEAHARARPDALAVADKQRKLTYRELDERANQLAHHLRTLGVGPDSVGVVCVERSVDFIVGALAILKAGGAYLPVDVAYPTEWQRQVVGDSGAKVVLSHRARAGSVEGAGAAVVCLDDASVLEAQPKHRPETGVFAENLAYSIYTSGSTGRPKGVAVTHQSLVNLGSWYQSTYEVKPEDRTTLVVGLSFDVSVWEVWLNLMVGASVHMPADEVRAEPRRLLQWLEEEQITVSFMATPMAEAVLEEKWSEGVVLRWLFTGGDKLHRRQRQELKKVALVNVYGPAENTVATTICTVEPEGVVEGLPHIGRPLANVRVYVLDERLAPLPVGVWGELYIGGESLGRGYLDRPALTAERFIPNPFEQNGARMYRTGDVVRYFPDGNIEFRGRNDFQVKIRGFRIELGEIQSVLDKHAGVRQSVVVVREDVPGNKRLVAYWVAQEGQEPEDSELREHLKQKLPAHMVPSAFVKLEKVPLTPNGKVDRKALPAPQGVSASSAEFEPPRNELEVQLAALWCGVLGVPQVGIHDDFFSLGGHSLLATQLISRIRSAFGVELPLRAIFERPTIAALADQLEGALVQSRPSAPSLLPTRREGTLPVSFAQRRMWILDQLNPLHADYNVFFALRMEGALEVDVLRRALSEVVRRHEALRTVFRSGLEGLIQVILPESSLSLGEVELSSLPSAAREAEMLQRAEQESQRPFDLAAGPLFRVQLLRLSDSEHVLLLNMHHIVSDGWSIGVLVREVAALYEAFSRGLPSPFPELLIQYADYASWQRQWLEGEVLNEQLHWWRQQLAGAPKTLELPTDKPRPAVQSFRGARVPVQLSKELSERLLQLCQREGVTPFMALLAAFQLLLSRYSHQDDVCVGSPIAGRRHAEHEGLIGFFVNTLVLRARFAGATSFRELLHQVRETTLGAFAHQDIPFEKLVEELQPQRDLSRSPLFQVIFALQNAPMPEMALPGLKLRPLEVENRVTKCDASLILTPSENGFHGFFEYATDLFEHSTVSRMMGHFVALLEAALSHPGSLLSELPLISEAERQQVLVTWNQTQRDYPRDACIHHLIQQQAALRPDAIAVEFGEQRLSWRELDSRSNQLAHLLRSHGVGPDSLVAIRLERSLELIVCLVGILKAGGAYVPLDASYPAQRLAFVLEDASPRLLLTTRALRSLLSLPDSLPCLFWDELSLEGLSTSAPDTGVTSRNLAYVHFTSGSTGRPKGVAIEHRSVVRLFHGARFAQFSPETSFLHHSPISSDATTLEIWGTLLFGGRVVVFPPQSPSDLNLLTQVLEQHGVSTLYLSADLLALAVDHKLDGLRGLRQLLTGGDAVSAPHARRVLEQLRIPLSNSYGPTEGTVIASCLPLSLPEQVGASISIGSPIANTQVYLLDASFQPVPPGVPGELFIGGEGLARGYTSRPELTAERFLPNPFSSSPGERLYRTGDLARWLADGTLEFLGHADAQVSLRGYRIELPEVESALLSHPEVREAVAVVREDSPGDKRLVAYVTSDSQQLDTSALRSFLKQRLPDVMLPSALVRLEALPLTSSSKVDRKALPPPDVSSTGRTSHFVEPTTPLERQLVSILSRELGIDDVGVDDHFFEKLGGTSLSVIKIATRMREELGREVPVTLLFEHPTVSDLARRLEAGTPQAPAPREQQDSKAAERSGPEDIAIIGMSGRFPGARSVDELWQNLRQGVESISRFSPEELEPISDLPEGIFQWQHPQFVPAGGVLADADKFDPGFFDISLREAQWMDPQQRLFLQTAWSALEDAGVDPERTQGRISLYAGASDSGYSQLVRKNVPLNPAAFFEAGTNATHQGMATKASYKLRLTGESLMVYTACSTGLVAVHMACESLRQRQSDVALAGATNLALPQKTGYVYQEGMILSPDGHCRAFDARAQGTVAGNGVAAVVLKRLSDAQRDGDSIYAVIKGSAINNDGHLKSGYTAPASRVSPPSSRRPWSMPACGPRTSATSRPMAPARRWGIRSKSPPSSAPMAWVPGTRAPFPSAR
ncbi:amino acid adenylation domain-containing protein [Archangium gephyra]|nr:amino acid adenylation domain-containing protein [Archangium gephyra]